MNNLKNKKTILRSIANCLLSIIIPMHSLAQSDPDTLRTNLTLNEVTVTASRISLPITQTVKQVTVLSKEEIQQAPIQSIQDLLNYVSGVDIQQRGPHGVQADISIRGGSFDQTAILLNGVNLSNPQTGHNSFNIPINLNDIERIEILHGPSSFVYGASAFSGGINIITKKDPDHKLYAKVQAGEHALWGVEAGGTLKTSTTSNQLSLSHRQSEGYTANSDYQISNTLWQTRLNAHKSTIDIQLGYNEKKYGANTFYSPLYPTQYEETQSYLASLKGETGHKLKFMPTLYWNRQYDQFQLIKGDQSRVPYNHHRTDVYGSNLNLQYAWHLGTTTLGTEIRNEKVLSTVLGQPLTTPQGKYTKEAHRTNISHILEHTYQLHNLTLTAGVMADRNTSHTDAYTLHPTAGISYRPLSHIKVHTSWSRATRMPTFTDLYYNTATHSGNANLKPEQSQSLDLGVNYTNHYLSLSLNSYLMHGENMIDWVKNQEKWQSVNHATIHKRGIEIQATLDLHKTLNLPHPNTTIRLAYNRLHQEGDNISKEQTSNYVLNYLRDKLTARLQLPIYGDKLTTTWNFRYQKRMGAYQDHTQSPQPANAPFPAFTTIDLMLNYKMTHNLLITLNINNLYNTHYFDLGSIPQPRRWIIGAVSYTLR